MNSKELHKHALPIMILALAVLTGTVGSAVSYRSSEPGRDLLSALTTPAVSVSTSKNGLATFDKVTTGRHQSNTEKTFLAEAELLDPLVVYFALNPISE